jgi:IgA Peptidase M64
MSISTSTNNVPADASKRSDTIFSPPEKVNPNGLNLVFYADRYDSVDEFNADVEVIMEEIKTIEPWKSYDYFNIYKIVPASSVSLCAVKTENERKPVLRCSTEINKYFEKFQLQKAKFVVLSRQEFQSWANISRVEDAGIFFSLPKKIEAGDRTVQGYLFLHLLGHAFGLKDEEKYVIARAGQEPDRPNGPNCAPDIKTAQAWWGSLAKKYPDRVGYYHTCAGSDTYIKPTLGSLMNLGDLSNFTPDYGPVSEEYLSKVLKYCFSDKRYKTSDDPSFFTTYPELIACVD